MPIYTYQCSSCGNRFELRQGWDAEAVAPCPKCQATAKRALVVPSVIFKGRGWYSTDSKRASHAGMVGSGAEGGGGGESSGAPAPASESKPAAASPD
jgi:putative FmdB family regulatory protein